MNTNHTEALSIEFLSDIVAEVFKGEEFTIVRRKRIDEGKGFVGILYRIELEWAKDTADRPDSLILKLPTAGKLNEKLNEALGDDALNHEGERRALLEKFHNVECHMYDLLRDSVVSEKVLIAKCYGSKPVGSGCAYLALQDLTSTSRTVRIHDGLSAEQTESVVEQIARIQAIGYHDPDWINAEVMQPMPKLAIERWLTNMHMAIQLTAKDFPKQYGRIANLKLLTRSLDVDTVYNRSIQDLPDQPPRCLVHGDIWANNLMFKAGTSELAAVLDWQICHPGHPAEDLARLLSSSLRVETRREIEERMLRLFYERIGELIKTTSKSLQYSFETLHTSYLESLFFSGIFMLMHSLLLAKAQNVEIPRAEQEELVERAVEAIADGIVWF